MRRTAGVIGILIVLSGCGFTLRGHQTSLKHYFPELSVNIEQRALRRALEQSLTAAQVTVVNHANIKLYLTNYSISRTPLAYGVDGKIRRERIEGQLTISVSDTKGEVLLSPRTLTAQRDHYRYSAYDLANVSEADRIEQDVQRDLLDQTLHQLSWLGQTLEQGTAHVEPY